jgi:maltose O-acetyltransferase
MYAFSFGTKCMTTEHLTPPAQTTKPSMLSRFSHVINEEFEGLHVKLLLCKLVNKILPPFVGGRLRVYLLRLAGFAIGKATTLSDMPYFTGSGDITRNFSMGSGCWMNTQCRIELAADVSIGNLVAIGPQVLILTTTHQLGPAEYRCAERVQLPVKIEDGVWIGARATILPGVTIGSGSVVAAGALVNRDVPPNTLVAGVPAQVVKALPLSRPERDMRPSEK